MILLVAVVLVIHYLSNFGLVSTKFYLDNAGNQHVFFLEWNQIYSYSAEDKCKTMYVSIQDAYSSNVINSSSYQARFISYNNEEHMFHCPQNINANLILVNKEWETELFKLSLSDIEREKRLVYGTKMINKALNLVKECCGITKRPINYPALVLAIVVPVVLLCITKSS